MKNIKAIVLEKYKDTSAFEPVSADIYKSLSDGNYRLTLSCELEEDEDSQYPLEDILDTYYVNCTDYFEVDTENDREILRFELEGSLSDNEENFKNIRAVSEIIGKRVYNKKENGSVTLVIE